MKVLFYFCLSSFFLLSQSVKLGVSNWIGHTPAFIATEMNLWSKHSVSLDLKKYSNEKEISNALKNGDIGIAIMSLGSMLEMYGSGEDLVFIFETAHADKTIKLIKDDNIDLKKSETERIISYSTNPDLKYFLDKSLKSYKRKISDFSVEEAESNTAFNHFKSRKNRIVCLNAPNSLEALKDAKGQLVSSGSDFTGVLREGWVMKRSTLKKMDKKLVKSMVLSWIDALKWMKEKKNMKSVLKVINEKIYQDKKLGFTFLKTILSSIKIHNKRQLESENNGSLVKYLGDLKAFMKKNKLLNRPFNPKYIVDTKMALEVL